MTLWCKLHKNIFALIRGSSSNVKCKAIQAFNIIRKRWNRFSKKVKQTDNLQKRAF